MFRPFALAAALSILPTFLASPLVSNEKRQSITTLSANQISAFTPFTFFASAAYCDPSTTINWSCGCELLFPLHLVQRTNACPVANCEANTGFLPTASGGDGSDVQFCELLLMFSIAYA